MPAPVNVGYHIVIKEYSLVIAVSRLQPSGLLLESVREFALSDTSAIEAGLNALIPGDQSGVRTASVSVRGRNARMCLSAAPVTEWLQQPECANLAPVFCASASPTGDVRSADKAAGTNLQALLPGVSMDQTIALLKQWNITVPRVTVTPFATAGAIVSWLQKSGGAVATLDLGETTSYWLVAERSGVIAVRPSILTMDVLSEILREELGLRFKGAAAKLFFNDQYDFSEVLPKIGAKLTARLKQEFEALPQNASALVFCDGLPVQQAWFGGLLAESLGRRRLDLDAKKFFGDAGLGCGTEVPPLSPGWLGVLQTVRSSVLPANIRLAEWRPLSDPAAAPAQESKSVATAAATPPPPPPTTKPAAPVSVSIPAPSKPTAQTPAKAVPASKPVPAVVEAPARPSTPAPVAVSEKAAPGAKAAVKTPGSVIAQPSPSSTAAAQKSAPVQPAKAEPPKPPEGRGSSALTYPLPGAKAASSARKEKDPTKKPPFWKSGAGIAVAGTAVVAIVVIFWLVSQMQSEKAAVVAEKARAAQETAKVMATARQAEAKAQAEVAARRQAEAEASAKLASLDAARRKAETEAREQTAARLANARGSLSVSTQPEGATVKIGALLSRQSPANFDDIKIGNYEVVVSLTGYDEVKKEVKIQENQTTDLGVIALHRQTGDLEITSTPGGAHFELRRTDVVKLGAQPTQGIAPASLAALPTGTYSIAIDYKGAGQRTGTIEVRSGAVVKSNWEFALGGIRITSTPSGATVSQEGKVLGRTPLALSDLIAGSHTYEFTRDGYLPARASAMVVKDDTQALNVLLTPSDRVYRPDELDRKPKMISSENLNLPPSFSSMINYSAVVTMVVGRDGVPKDIEVLKSNDREFGQICMAAVAKWRFKPALVNNRPVSTRGSVPFVVNAR